MRINTNISALRASNNLNATNNKLTKSLERLSSGYRINRAADDAAGLAISQKMKTQIDGLNQANRNASDGISLIQTAEGALVEVQNMTQRMRELSVQAANGTNTDEDRASIQAEIDQLTEEIQRISETTEFNTIHLLDGTCDAQTGVNGVVTGALTLQIGANENQTLDISIPKVDPVELGIQNIEVDTSDKAEAAITACDNAIAMVSKIRSELGAFQNRLEHTINNLSVAAENMTEALSRVSDTDMASEMATYTQNNVLVQAGTSMLAQANQRPQQILSLLNA